MEARKGYFCPIAKEYFDDPEKYFKENNCPCPERQRKCPYWKIKGEPRAKQKETLIKRETLSLRPKEKPRKERILTKLPPREKIPCVEAQMKKKTTREEGKRTREALRIEEEEEIRPYKEQLLKLKTRPVPFRRILSPGIAWLVANEKGPDNEAKRQITELKGKGADIVLILNAVLFPGFLWKAKTGIPDMTFHFSKADMKEERKIRTSFTRLINLTDELTPVLPETLRGQRIRESIAKMRADLKAFVKGDLQEYFDLKLSEPCLKDLVREFPNAKNDIIFRIYPPNRIAETRRKGLNLTMHLWNETIVILVKELHRNGYSWNESYEKTAKLLNLFYPDIYTDTDRDLIRQRYTYHSEKLRPSLPRQK